MSDVYIETGSNVIETPSASTGYSILGAYDPYESGTFWGKWIARNPYKSAYKCRVYDGYMGDAIADMRCRSLLLDSIDGPNDGVVSMTCIDLFTLIDRQKAVAPVASLGELLSGIAAGATTATLSPAGIGDAEYPASFVVIIGEELMIGTRSSDTLTFSTRGAYGTTAVAHDAEDLVQTCLLYTAQLSTDIAYDLLLNYTSLTVDELPLTDWYAASVGVTNVYTAVIAEPTAVIDLIGELSQLDGFTLWPNVDTGLVEYSALRAKEADVTVTDDAWIVDGSISIKDENDRRASEVWVYYGQHNPVEDLDKKSNYHSRVVTIDTSLAADEKYGTSAIVEIFSRWIPQNGRSAATRAGELILNMFAHPPKEIEFSTHQTRSSSFRLADHFTIKTAEIQDEVGALFPITVAAVEIERGENELNIRSQQVRFGALEDSSGDRLIYIENDASNINLRAIHDSLFVAPVGGSPGEVVRFIINAGVTVHSNSTSTPAIDTGSWPDGVSLHIDVGESTGTARIQGAAGAGGTGGGVTGLAAVAGGVGGDAILATFRIFIDNLYGEIWAGGGGGGGGGTANYLNTFPPPVIQIWEGGGGGGGGGGIIAGAAGAQGLGGVGGRDGGAGSATAGGGGGAGTPTGAGAGGAGGGPGIAGAAGVAGITTGAAAGGAAGNYINGTAFAVWINNGSRLGNTV